MSFDQDAFISYAHIDNEPLTPGQKGWVSQFHATLQAMLSQRLGEKARIWRDEKLDGNDVFADEIVEQFAKTALLVSIFSPRYVRSEWCTRELRKFCEVAARNGGVTIGNKSRSSRSSRHLSRRQSRCPRRCSKPSATSSTRSTMGTRRSWTRPLATRRVSSF